MNLKENHKQNAKTEWQTPHQNQFQIFPDIQMALSAGKWNFPALCAFKT